MKKIGFVIPWYGDKIPGGAEAALRGIVKNLIKNGIQLEVLTTCVKEFTANWNRNYHKPGLSVENTVPVRRFKIRKRNEASFNSVCAKLIRGIRVAYEEEHIFVNEMVNSPDLYNYMATHDEKYELFVFIPYMFGTSYFGIQVNPAKSIMIPCFHDESYVYMELFKEHFPEVRGMIFNSYPEKVLAEKVYDLTGVKKATIGIGVDIDVTGSAQEFRTKFKISEPFILYAGRKDAGKNVELLINFFELYKKRHNNSLKLVFLGGGEIHINRDLKNHVFDLGFVSVQDKHNACSAASFLCQPSVMESFSIVIMESWLCGRPVLVHSDCPVTVNFATESNGGLYFRTYHEFAGCVNYFLEYPEIAGKMGALGREYVLSNFSWDVVSRKYISFFEELCPNVKQYQYVEVNQIKLSSDLRGDTRKKIAIVVQRFGVEIAGGSESLAMQYALHLGDFYDVDVITTTCVDYVTWENHYPAGTTLMNGVKVIRFETTQNRTANVFNRLSSNQLDNITAYIPTEYDDEWLEAQGPYCPALLSYIEEHEETYDAFLFFTYLYYPTAYGLPLVAEKSIFVPTAHDEPWIRLEHFKKLFLMPRYFCFLTEEEKNFVHTFFGNDAIKHSVVGIGIDVPKRTKARKFKKKYNIKGRYVIYVGRIDISKGCDEMISGFMEYKKAHPSSLKLVLVGSSHMEIPEREDIIVTGFVDEQTKFDGISGAEACISPSKWESLCIALLEGFALGVPALMNGQCDVLRGHCDRSGAGLYYGNEDEFCDLLHKLLIAEHKNMREKAVAYVKAQYTWEWVVRKLCDVIEYVCSLNTAQGLATHNN